MARTRATETRKAGEDDSQAVFERLKAILKPFERSLIVTADEPDHYSLNTPYAEKYKKDLLEECPRSSGSECRESPASTSARSQKPSSATCSA